MINHKRYLVITEFDDTGHVIGSYDSLEEAQKIAEEVFNIQQPKGGSEYYYEDMHDLRTYKVHPTGRHITPHHPYYQTNGFYSALVLDSQSIMDFSLEQFMFTRTNTIYAYDLDKYDVRQTTFVKDLLLFIAN